MKTQHWPDRINLFLGLWVAVAPQTMAHLTAGAPSATGLSAVAQWIDYATGIAVASLAVLSIEAFARWKQWITLGLGLWLCLSPWLLGFSGQLLLRWNASVVGMLIALLAAWMIF